MKSTYFTYILDFQLKIKTNQTLVYTFQKGFLLMIIYLHTINLKYFLKGSRYITQIQTFSFPRLFIFFLKGVFLSKGRDRCRQVIVAIEAILLWMFKEAVTIRAQSYETKIKKRIDFVRKCINHKSIRQRCSHMNFI